MLNTFDEPGKQPRATYSLVLADYPITFHIQALMQMPPSLLRQALYLTVNFSHEISNNSMYM